MYTHSENKLFRMAENKSKKVHKYIFFLSNKLAIDFEI